MGNAQARGRGRAGSGGVDRAIRKEEQATGAEALPGAAPPPATDKPLHSGEAGRRTMATVGQDGLPACSKPGESERWGAGVGAGGTHDAVTPGWLGRHGISMQRMAWTWGDT